MPFDQAHKQYETARHLPPPLYVLFVQASAYGQACGECQGGHSPQGHPEGLSPAGGETSPQWDGFNSCLQKALLQGCLFS